MVVPGAVALTPELPGTVVRPGDEVTIVKPPADKKLYRRLRLPNGMLVLLISDPAITKQSSTHSHGGQPQSMSEEDSEDEDSSKSSDEDTDMDSGEENSDGEDGGSKSGSNGIRRAAAAMAVGVGSLLDPKHLPGLRYHLKDLHEFCMGSTSKETWVLLQGLSHYLEHMLFMGSAKFPDENSYDAFLSAHAGSSNAYTELEYTNYHFDVAGEALQGALDRFAQFFVDPLCKADALEREVMAVDSEFSGVLQSDSCRLQQLRCHTSRQGHLFNRFTWGNRSSLLDEPRKCGIDVRKDLVDYYRQHYSAERMSLVVMGGESLEQLEGWVWELFTPVSSGQLQRPTFFGAGMPFEGGQLYILPAVKEAHEITASFCLPSLITRYRTKADEYISHLVGHEGKGSLLSALKASGWVTDLTAGVGESGFERSTAVYVFEVHMTLTEAGLHAEPGCGLAPLGLLFQYLALLRQASPQRWVYEELAATAAMRFRFAEEEDPCDFVTRLAEDAPYYAPEHILQGSYLYDQWEPELVEELLDCMHPAAVRLDLQTSAFDQLKQHGRPSTEPWFGVPFAQCPVPAACLAAWQDAWESKSPRADMALPPRNEFLPSDFSLRSEGRGSSGRPHVNGAAAVNGTAAANDVAAEGAPTGELPSPPDLLLDVPGQRVWHKLDERFRVPKAAVLMQLHPRAREWTAQQAAATQLAVKLLEDALCETTYLASTAGLQYEVCPLEGCGIQLRVQGFSHKLPLLTRYITHQLATLTAQAEAFAHVREPLARRYRNANTKPDRHATFLRKYVLMDRCFSPEAVLAGVEALTPAEVQGHLADILGDVHIEMLVHGNLDQAEAQQLAEAVASDVHGSARSAEARLPADQRRQERGCQVPDGRLHLHRVPVKNPEENNSVVELYVQSVPDNLHTRSLLDLMEQVMHEPCYDALRTKQQLGYTVHCGVRLTHGVLGFAVVVVSGSHAPDVLQERIEAFLQGFAETLASMAPEELEKQRAAIIAAKLQACDALFDETEEHWQHISNRKYDFEARRQEAQELKRVTRQQLLDLYQDVVKPGAPSRRCFAVHIVGKPHLHQLQQELPDVKNITDLDAFKQQLALHPPVLGNPPAPVLQTK